MSGRCGYAAALPPLRAEPASRLGAAPGCRYRAHAARPNGSFERRRSDALLAISESISQPM
jgi:hypothetical protein